MPRRDNGDDHRTYYREDREARREEEPDGVQNCMRDGIFSCGTRPCRAP